MCSNLHFPSTEAYSSIDIRIFILEVNYVGMSSSGQLTDIVWPKAHTITHTVSTDWCGPSSFIQPVHPKGDQSWVFTGRTDVEAESPILWPHDAKS